MLGVDRRVALKLVRSKVAANDPADTCTRLMNEARAMARLRHPNVLTIYEVGEEEGRVYFAMEQVEGGSLRDRQVRLGRERTSPWRAILDLYVAAGRGLAAAHAAGIVHRDFKPDNVLVNRHLFALLFTAIAMSLAASGGFAALGLGGDVSCRVLLLMWTAMAAMVAAALGVWLWIAAAAYAAAFVVSWLVPGALHVAIAGAHCA